LHTEADHYPDCVVISSGLQSNVTTLEVESVETGSTTRHAARNPSFLRRHGLGLLMAVATSALMAWGLGHVAFWLDEGATAVAMQRTWPHLWVLMHGAEAPLVPYYALLKVFSGVVRHVVPAAASHPEILLRLPSAVLTVIAGWALIAWLSRFSQTRLVLCTGAVLLLIGGLSRYGQEARPYAPVLFAAVVSTILWTQLITDRRRRWIVLYALAVAVTVVLHNLSGGLVAAHLVAAAVAPERGERRSALLRTIAGAVPGLLLALPLAIASARNGLGASYYPNLTATQAITVFVRLFDYGDHPLLGVGPVVLLAAIGLTRVNSEQYRFIARLAASWALVPLAVLLLACLKQPNLLFGRYVLFVIPAWAILAGLGLVTVMDLVRGAIRRAPVRSGRGLSTVVATVVAIALLAGTAAEQWWTLTVIRTAGGHGEDIRPALATAKRPEYANLPIVISSQLGASELSAYDRSLERRIAGLRPQRSETSIWAAVPSYASRKRFLSKQTQIILLERSRGVDHCEETLAITPPAQIERCMPPLLQTLHYRVVRMEPSGRGWAFAILQR
jgi:hypothetical protein